MGPILFIIYVNDLPEVVQSKLWMFADDTKIYHTISSNEDSILLQNNLSSIMKWCSTWLMDSNYGKCKCMSFGNRTLPMSQYLMSTGEEDISVMRVCEQLDLGVLFTSEFKFGPHIHHIVQKANRLIGLIKKSFDFLDAPMLRTLYTSLVCPYLDYACVVWCPFQLGDIRIIEKVQRRATKIIQSLKDKSYYDRLVSLNLPSLLYRRRRMDVIMVYLIVVEDWRDLIWQIVHLL